MPNKAKDFKDSALNLCNPEPVKELLEKLSDEQAKLKAINDELEVVAADLIKKGNTQKLIIEGLDKQIRAEVEEHGSYQDTENERYAVKYARKTAVYGNIEAFKKNFPKFAELCIKEAIDITALNGQLKGKLITQEQLEEAKVLTWDTGYAFYIR